MASVVFNAWSSHLLPLTRSQFARNVGKLAGGTVLAQALLVAVSPVLTRIYSVRDFGHFQVYLSISVFLFVLAALRLELAVLLADSETRAVNVMTLALGVVASVSMLVWLLVSMGPVAAVLARRIPPLASRAWLLPLSTLGAGGYLVLSHYALRRDAYGTVAATRVTQTATMVSSQLLLGGLKLGALGLLGSDVLGRCVGCLTLARRIAKQSGDLLRRVTLRGVAAAGRRYCRFALGSSGAALVNTAGIGLPALMLASAYGAQVVGWFALVERVTAAPAALVGQALAQAYSVEVSRRSRDDLVALQRSFFTLLSRLALLGIVPFGILVLAGPWLFETVFGPEWREAGVYVRILAPMEYVGFVARPLINTLNLLERQTWQLYWDSGRVAAIVTALPLAAAAGAGARHAILVYAGVFLLANVAHIWLSHTAIRLRIRDLGAA